MNRAEVLHILTSCQSELQRTFGVKSLSLFGSVARDEATDVSDIDLLVEFDRPTGYFGLMTLQEYLEHVLQCRVDIGTVGSLKPRLRAKVLQECVYVG